MEGSFRADGNKIKNMGKVFILRNKFKDGKEVNLSDIFLYDPVKIYFSLFFMFTS